MKTHIKTIKRDITANTLAPINEREMRGILEVIFISLM